MAAMERPHGSWIAVAVVLIASSLAAQDPDLCAGSGGTADCDGPATGPYSYEIGNAGWSASGFGSDTAAIDRVQTCAAHHLMRDVMMT
jgi:hypothetical protein